jgi:ribose transport system permease protein
MLRGPGPATPDQAARTGNVRAEQVLTFGNVLGRDAGELIVLFVLFVALAVISDQFLTIGNLANLARQVAIFGIIAVGELMVILTACIDLSVGSVRRMSGCVAADLSMAPRSW